MRLFLLLLLLLSSGSRAYAPDAPQPVGLLCYTCTILVFIRRSHFRRQYVSSRDPLVPKGGNAQARNIANNFCLKCWLPCYILGIFYVLKIYDMGPTALLPLRRKACWGIFCPLKIRQLRPGLNPQTWVSKDSMLSLDHQSHYATVLNNVCVNPYPTAFPYGNGMVLHFYQQQESSTTKTVHKVINKGLKAYV